MLKSVKNLLYVVS